MRMGKTPKMLSIVFVSAMFIGWITCGLVMATPAVNLTLVDTPDGIGDTFEVDVWADGDDIGLELLSFGFDVDFDVGSIYTYNGYTLGSGLEDSSFGDANVSGFAFPGISDDDVLLAILSFTAIAAGEDTLLVTGLYDGVFSGLFYEESDTIEVGYNIVASLDIANPVPIPSGFLLLGSGLIGLVGKNRLKRRSIGRP